MGVVLYIMAIVGKIYRHDLVGPWLFVGRALMGWALMDQALIGTMGLCGPCPSAPVPKRRSPYR